jgi:hypothetical protein
MLSVVAKSCLNVVPRSHVMQVSLPTITRSLQCLAGKVLHPRQHLPLAFPFGNIGVNFKPLPPKATAPNMVICRGMNRNARRPKKANHGKRPVSHARKRQKAKGLKSRLYREKVFGFW